MKKIRIPVKSKEVKKQVSRLVSDKILSSGFVSAVAGDRDLNPDEKKIFEKLQELHGDRLYTKMLFALTHRFYHPETAKELWDELVKHKDDVSEKLGRNIGIEVAVADYLLNFKDGRHVLGEIASDQEISIVTELSLRDGLTQLFDYFTFYSKLEKEISLYKRYRAKLTLVMLDVDNFDEFVKGHGKLEGKEILFEIGEILRNTTRDLDVCARYGGKEFAIILPQCGPEKAELLVERIKKSMTKSFKNYPEINVSVGIASCPKHAKSLEDLVEKAEMALDQARTVSNNKVAIFQKQYPEKIS
ncbi:MAG: GGDEF domain-containing protein [Candidatus Theseobacter exili]|nr:GGDEF domain-containing protein [Candidatus Theseobacter exili]